MKEVSALTEMPSGVLAIIISLLLMVSWYFLTRTLGKIDKNQTDLFQKHGDHEKRISHIEGRCEVEHGRK